MTSLRSCGPLLLAVCALAQAAAAQALLLTDIGADNFADVGSALAGGQDVDGDGLDDLIVGAPGDDTAGPSFGAAYVYSGLDGSVLHTVFGDASSDDFGRAVALLGDLDGDRRSEFLVGAPFANPMGNDSGLARVYSGASGSLLFEHTGTQSSDRLGWAVAATGDVDLDGVPDYLVAEPHIGVNGRALLYSGADGTLIRALLGFGGNEGMAAALAGLGDVNGDGHPDQAVTLENVEQVRVFSGADGSVLSLFESPAWADGWGHSVAGAGDIDADGRADLIVGAPDTTTTMAQVGAAQVLSGADGSVLHEFIGWAGFQRLGHAVAGAGDVDGDGRDDLLIGMPGATAGFGAGVDCGRIQVYSGLDGHRIHSFTLPEDTLGERLGSAVAAAGDLDGDGFADVLGGAPRHTGFASKQGRFFAWSLRHVVTELQPDRVRSDLPGVVELRGAGFEDGPPITVRFGGLPASDVTWHSPELVSCVPPPGLGDAVVDVTYEQSGLLVELATPLTYEGPVLLDVHPHITNLLGGTVLEVGGRHFHGTTDEVIVTVFGGANYEFELEVLEVLSPERLRVQVPPPSDEVPDGDYEGSMKVTTAGGTAIKHLALFGTEDPWLDVASASIRGGDVVTVQGPVPPPPSGTYHAFIAGQPAEVLSVLPHAVALRVPPVSLATGDWQDVKLVDAVQGNGPIVDMAFRYAPFVRAEQSGDTFSGGLDLDLLVGLAAADAERPVALSLWLVDVVAPFTGQASAAVQMGGASQPATPGTLPGLSTSGTGGTPGWGGSRIGGPYGALAGPLTRVLMPEVELAAGIVRGLQLEFGMVPVDLIGLELTVQGVVRSETDPSGTLTNSFEITLQ